MTANEKSTRYKSVHEMSADFKSRFGTNVMRITYPDLDVLPGQVPGTLMRLASAVVIDKYGNIPVDNPATDRLMLAKFVKSCHRLQRLFSIPLEDLDAGERSTLPVDISRNAGTGKTALKSETIPPRMMTAILKDLVDGGRSGVTLKAILGRYVEGVTDANDRAVIKTILTTDGLL